MATVIAIMDRDAWDANTDVLVVADAERQSLTWVPRDLWCPPIGHRINKAFARGGFPLLLSCLRDLGFSASGGICLRRSAVARALNGISVTVPVEEPLRLWYPLEPEADLSDGRKPVDFDPPSERLEGERIHQWIGARRSRLGPSSDLHRIARQQVFLQALLEQRFPFWRAIEDPHAVRFTGQQALTEAASVREGWSFRTMDDVLPAEIEGMNVLVRRIDDVPAR